MSAARRPLGGFAGPWPLCAAVLALMTTVLVLTPASPASAADAGACDHSLGNALCQAGHAVLGTGRQVPGPGGLTRAAQAATHAVDALNPQNFLDTWAQGLAHAVIFELAFIETTVEKLGMPAFAQQWWIEQYAVSFGLGMIVLPFLLAGITARTAGPEGGVTGVALLRRSGWRMAFVVPACAIAPAVLYSVTQVATGLERTFSTPAAAQGDGAVGGLLGLIQGSAGKGWSDVGGTVMAILMFALLLVFGTVLVIEVFVSNWGVLLIGLLLPLALVAAVYPPWGRLLRRICGILGSLLFLPAVILLFFWTVWSGFNSMVGKQGGADGSFTKLVFLLVSLLVIDVFPILAFRLLGTAGSNAEQLDARGRAGVPQPSAGDVHDATFSKLEPQWGRMEAFDEGTGPGAAGSGGAIGEAPESGGEDKGLAPFGPPGGEPADAAEQTEPTDPTDPTDARVPGPVPGAESPSGPVPEQAARHDCPDSFADEAAVWQGGAR